MSTTLTPNLKLRVDSELTNDAKFNLNRIDTLGGASGTSNTGDAFLRSLEDILIEPNSSTLGGSGTGGIIYFGNSTATYDFKQGSAIDLVFDCDLNAVTNIRNSNIATDAAISGIKILPEFGAQTVKTSDSLEFELVGNTTTIRPAQSGQTEDLVFTLPSNDGASGQVLTTDGSGGLSWTSAAGVSSLTVSWLAAEGLKKLITHNFGTRNVIVQVMDNNNNYRTIDLEVDRISENTVELDSTEVPETIWTVMLIAI